ncbi:vWA domain-containing protein [Streptomyces nigrescens]|uniref:Substrate-binding domain-containing protein n=1 Tax=Streptomyces nigrescens TaxID=1920 RepID=A0ABY7JC08_STRNI|nr:MULTISPECIES: VWA domain-containing protein [Streptomyces]MCX5450612.1 VWA domain-containing protein [Streptomyces libani]WAU07692.1 substrate-binding domain-containing protein [Streptomyces nigrescens]
MAEYDARGKVNRALLICVDDYRRLRPLPAVRDNPRELERVLLAPGTDLFTKGEVVICRPQEPWEVEQALDAVTQEARGLLLVYFSGHGRVGPDGGNLQLMVGASERRHKTVSWQDLVLSYLDNARADRIVIVLECCYAGNAGEAFHACRTPTSLLMAAQPNRRIFSGEEPTGGSVFTRALLRTLEQGIPGKRFVTFEDLVRELREQLAGERTPMGDVWEPRSAKQNTVDDVILSFATPEIRPPTPLRIRLRRRLNSRFRHWFRILMVLAIILVPATAGVVLLNLPNDAEACPPALELRLLTAPEAEPALRQAAFDYEMSDANTRPLNGEGDLPDGCRRAQITVYSAAKDQVDQGFAAAGRWQGEAHGTGKDGPDDQGIDPLHRPGPQPDIWIPESTADYYAARRGMPAKGSPATLHYSAPVAYTPLVVGIPAHRRLDDVEPAAASWRKLLTGTDRTHHDLRLLRPSPVLSGTGLLHTIGLYLTHDGTGTASSGAPDLTLARHAEERLSAPGSQYAGSTELLCSLRPDADAAGAVDRTKSAPLVSEKSLADYNLGRATGSCPALDSPLPLRNRYVAYYPENVPALDHPLIRVDWRGTTDATPRQAAVARFATWLRAPDGGQRTLTAQGYRGVKGTGPAPGSPLLDGRADISLVARTVPFTADPAQVTQVLDGYDKAQRSSQVLVLLDTSTSMADGGRLPTALSAAGRVLEMVGARHTYGLWAFPDRAHPTDADAVRELVPLGSADPAPGRAALDRIAGGELVEHGAAMEEALTRAVRRMKKSPAANKAIVLILDQDDGAGPGRAAGVERTLGTLVEEGPEVPILALVMGKSGCDTFALQRLAGASHGQCVPGGPQAVDTLAGRIASIGTATKGDR